MREKYIREALKDIIEVWDNHSVDNDEKLIVALFPAINKARRELWLENVADAVTQLEEAIK